MNATQPYTEGEIPTIRFSGGLDFTDVPLLRERIAAARGASNSVVVIARDVTHVDSSALLALLQIDGDCRKHEGRLVISEPSPSIARILHVTGLNRVLGVTDTLDQAFALFKPARGSSAPR